MKTTLLKLLIASSLLTGTLAAQPGNLGLGVEAGTTTGINARYWPNAKRSLHLSAAWGSTPQNYMILQGSYVFYLDNVFPWKTGDGRLPLYFGLGLHTRISQETEVGLRAPIGLSYILPITPLEMFVEVSPTVTLTPSLAFGDPHVGNVEARAGFTYYFGGSRDFDGDGITNKLDKCPKQPEDKDGFQDDDGCPDPDNDGDGIPDVVDKSPMQAEDMDGYMDTDGAPDPDNDGDGIPDVQDECPNEPETMNGYADKDGCPDEKPEPEIKILTEQPVILEGVNFKFDSAELTVNSSRILDLVFNTLQNHPNIRVEIAGHTDSIGTKQYNLDLSQRRAESVKRYLVGKGIDPGRIKAVGYGESRPIADNGTKEGRAKNRRITIIRLNN